MQFMICVNFYWVIRYFVLQTCTLSFCFSYFYVWVHILFWLNKFMIHNNNNNDMKYCCKKYTVMKSKESPKQKKSQLLELSSNRHLSRLFWSYGLSDISAQTKLVCVIVFEKYLFSSVHHKKKRNWPHHDKSYSLYTTVHPSYQSTFIF